MVWTGAGFLAATGVVLIGHPQALAMGAGADPPERSSCCWWRVSVSPHQRRVPLDSTPDPGTAGQHTAIGTRQARTGDLFPRNTARTRFRTVTASSPKPPRSSGKARGRGWRWEPFWPHAFTLGKDLGTNRADVQRHGAGSFLRRDETPLSGAAGYRRGGGGFFLIRQFLHYRWDA